MPKRNDEVAPPRRAGEWHLKFGTSDAAKTWTELCRQLPGNMREAWERMRFNPLERTDTQKRLSGDLGSRAIGGVDLPQWQIDVSAGGRVWYCVDEATETVWVTLASASHPGATTSKGKNTSRNR